MLRSVILLILFSAFYLTANCQQNDLSLLRKIAAQKSVAAGDLEQPDNTSHKALRFPTRVLFGFYRNTLSEQISADCAYDLSCSRFSIQAIRRFGILKGGLLTADRLTRCGAFAAKNSVSIFYNARTAKVIDDPAMY